MSRDSQDDPQLLSSEIVESWNFPWSSTPFAPQLNQIYQRMDQETRNNLDKPWLFFSGKKRE